MSGKLLVDTLAYGRKVELPDQGTTLPDQSDSMDETDMDYYSDSDTDSEYSLSAQRQWEESINQITGLVHFVLFPLVGKLLGRRTAHVLWRNFANWWFP